MPKKYIVKGDGIAQYREFDGLRSAETVAQDSAKADSNMHRPIEYSIYQRIQTTETRLVSTILRTEPGVITYGKDTTHHD